MALTPDEIHNSLLKRKVIHFDMDCFYAAVEMRNNPSLKDKPVIVGGQPNSRGVVCTANYIARRFGVRSAMSAAQAKKLCPEGVFLQPNFSEYKEASSQIRAIFKKYTSVIEPLSLDEAYLDVTDNPHQLYAVKIARLIQQEIHNKLHLTGSAGVAPNKLVAKIASDYRKPHGITVVLPEKVLQFMGGLKLRKISGIGPASEKRLNQLGLIYCQDVWQHSRPELCNKLGQRMGNWLFERVRGIDERPVKPRSQRKSLGKEDTFAKDISEPKDLEAQMRKLTLNVTKKLQLEKLQAKTITIKVKFSDFKQITRSKTLTEFTDYEQTFHHFAKQLLEKIPSNHKPIRLLGFSVSNLNKVAETGCQL